MAAANEQRAIDLLCAADFTVLNLIGRGSFGLVFRCVEPLTADVVAVKVALDERCRAAAIAEAHVLAGVPRHPNLLPINSISVTEESAMLSMPFASGGDSLAMMLARDTAPLPQADVHSLFTQLVDAVAHLHEHGVVHRDIKCENILLSGQRRRHLLLADFGLATAFEPGKATLTSGAGTLFYAAPEIVRRQAYEGPEVDVWSMGVVLYAWASGRLPFGGDTKDEIRERISVGAFERQAAIPPLMAELIAGMLTVERSKRFTIAQIRAHAWFQGAAAKSAASALEALSSRSAPKLFSTERVRRHSDPKSGGRATRLLGALAGLFSRGGQKAPGV